MANRRKRAVNKESIIQYRAIVYVHEKNAHINIPQIEKSAKAKNIKLHQQQATNGKIIVTDVFLNEGLREEWESSLLQLSPQPKNFFATELKVCGKNKRTLSAQAKKALDSCKGHFVGEREKNDALFLIVSFDNPNLRSFWEGTVNVLKS